MRDGHGAHAEEWASQSGEDRKSTRLNSSHANISYAVFCLKKKNESSPLFRMISFCSSVFQIASSSIFSSRHFSRHTLFSHPVPFTSSHSLVLCLSYHLSSS